MSECFSFSEISGWRSYLSIFHTRKMRRLKIRVGLSWCQRTQTIIKLWIKRSQMRSIHMVKNDLRKWSRNNYLKTITLSVWFSAMESCTSLPYDELEGKNPTNWIFKDFSIVKLKWSFFFPSCRNEYIASLTHLHLEWSMTECFKQLCKRKIA